MQTIDHLTHDIFYNHGRTNTEVSTRMLRAVGECGFFGSRENSPMMTNYWFLPSIASHLQKMSRNPPQPKKKTKGSNLEWILSPKWKVSIVIFEIKLTAKFLRFAAEEDEETFETNWDLEVNKFDDMGLKEEVLRGIYGYGYKDPSPIQMKGILPVIQGKDTIA